MGSETCIRDSFSLLGWKPFHEQLWTDVAEHATVTLDLPGEQSYVVENFATSSPQFPTGVYMQEGSRYQVRVESITEPWVDPGPLFFGDKDSDNEAGYSPNTVQWLFSWPALIGPRKKTHDRRTCPMFMLMGRIGAVSYTHLTLPTICSV